MNGRLHLGHAFSLTKSEFAIGFQRMQGKKALWPFGFHCTGMPIQAAAYKLKKEYELYGMKTPEGVLLPNFPPAPPEVVTLDPDGGAITIGWRAPTSTGGLALKGFQVYFRAGGAESEWTKSSDVDAVDGEVQYSSCVTGLVAGEQYAFKVKSVVEGVAGVDSRILSKTADGKKDLKLLAAKKDDKEKKVPGGPPKGAKTKVAAKTGGLTTQWDILRSMGLSPKECEPFVDPVYWLEYFPPLGQKDLTRFGIGVDWRRTFITTDYNPYYDSFVRWQFHKLKAGNFVAFGKRPAIFSEADKQPCMDHDRDKGEGVNPQEYTAIKMRLLEPFPEVLCSLQGRTIYLLAGTLRPETMCGQTNAWILPEGDYGAFEVSDAVVYICAARAARNMSFQDIFNEWGNPKQLLSLKGQALIGCAVKSPLTKYERIYMLPLTTISMTKGTAIVTSVPSDSPDDYAAFMDLKNPKKRAFYGVQDEWIAPFDLIPVLTTPDLGDMSAKFMCEKLQVNSQKDVEKLKEAHDACYTSGFYKGIMTAGPFVGKTVQVAKVETRKKMVQDGEAITYLEPEGFVTPRSTPDTECVVALVDQWYLKYGESDWQAKVKEHLEKTLECYNPAVHKLFREALDWLGDWACSRSFGLGTRMPWDEQFLIESLSDSTIYMSYYLVAHLLQGHNMFGKEEGPAGISAAQCDEAFWDHVLLGRPYQGDVPAETMLKLRREVTFWYPLDLRVSGKDLVPNHLTMSLYNHAAVWNDQSNMWPQSFYCNGHVQVDAEKMSKSKGNFITLTGAIAEWGADATRFTCADAGDGTENANYNRVTADRCILALTTELDWIGAALNNQSKDIKLRSPSAPRVWLDDWFENEMGRVVSLAAEGFRGMRFREALKHAFYGMQDARDKYRSGTSQVGVLEPLIRQWAEWQALIMAPITPHWAEEIWEYLGHTSCIVKARWPQPSKPEEPALTIAGQYLFKLAHDLSTAVVNRDKKKGKAKGTAEEKPNQINLYIATTFPKWKQLVLELLKEHFDPQTYLVDDKVMPMFKTHAELNSFNKGKQVPQFAAAVREEAKSSGASAFALKMPFNEAAVVTQNLAYLKTTLSVNGIQAVHVYTDKHDLPNPDLLASAAPGKPAIDLFFANEIAEPQLREVSSEVMMDYLNDHNVAEVLNEAVNRLGREQPTDPFSWLSAYLAKKGK
eukprot:CAMPEP_0119322566 /NCGR_PEP_ID=MMETSP1333-20130426/58600_1 /TAXON_ID=418940 /ORGANISM="Scyphosphaera apsteinii, Strain RCC1455" /LENGTH=1184 /DNA_ID=CAMNT_0007329827 /DNA_START=45 /DNA_END=3599 /DNA_ORIENTATION=-